MAKTPLIRLRSLVILTLVALGLHWVWEVLHGPAYVGLPSRWMERAWGCIPMVIGDIGLTLVIFLASLLIACRIRKDAAFFTAVFISPLFGVKKSHAHQFSIYARSRFFNSSRALAKRDFTVPT